jgi:hypothetical protein
VARLALIGVHPRYADDRAHIRGSYLYMKSHDVYAGSYPEISAYVIHLYLIGSLGAPFGYNNHVFIDLCSRCLDTSTVMNDYRAAILQLRLHGCLRLLTAVCTKQSD